MIEEMVKEMVQELKRYYMVFSYFSDIIEITWIKYQIFEYIKIIKEELIVFRDKAVDSDEYKKNIVYYTLNKEVFDSFIKKYIVKGTLL